MNEARRISLIQTMLRGVALLVLAAGLVLSLVYHQSINPGAIRDSIAAHPVAPVVFIVLQIAASLLFVPRTALGIAAGLLFGFGWGLVWSMAGAIMGAAAGFAFTRWLGAKSILERWPQVVPMVERVEKSGWRAVAILRLTLVPHSVANTALAMTRVSWSDYLFGSALGMLPMTVAQVQIGASGGLVLHGQGNWLLASLLLAGGLLLSFGLKYVLPYR
ncbi:MAG TPA: VTT domain-containing protein [Rhizomicrobium sp.]|nr:VTT domain-containing protein [Rhizomicrobium sp.]